MLPPGAQLSKQHSEDNLAHFEGCHFETSVTRWNSNGESTIEQDFIAVEAAVALSYNGISHAVMMATPADLEDFALGFSLTEGILHSPSELYDLDVEKRSEGTEVLMNISAQRITELKQRRRNLTGRTGCGLCGTESLSEAIKPVKTISGLTDITDEAIQNAVNSLHQYQTLQNLCGAVHGAAWCNSSGEIQFIREDVGRHNALDKLIGAIHRQSIDSSDGFVFVTSRASYEMVQKTSSQGIGALAAVSAPTSLAIDLAKDSGLKLFGFSRPGRHVRYTQCKIVQISGK